jgi:hypothetical protein
VENRFQSLPFKCNLQRYITVSVYVRDAIGAVSAPASYNVTVTWPALASDAAATAATAAGLLHCTSSPSLPPHAFN